MNVPDPGLIAALRQALDKDPHNAPLWLHFASVLDAAGETDEAIAALRTLLELDGEDRAAIARLVPLLRARGHTAEALIRCEKLLEEADDPTLRIELARILHVRADHDAAREHYRRALASDGELRDATLEDALDGDHSADGEAPAEAAEAPELVAPDEPGEPDERQRSSIAPDAADPDAWAKEFEWDDLVVRFDDVAGMTEVKKQINLRIIAPFKSPEIYQAFGRSAGGGLLLYGPPGCGKTYIARATATECGARFLRVGINEIVDQYWGQSEKLVHALFEEARRRTPTVLFFDEFDALGSSRGKSESNFWKVLVDQILQEMDGIGSRNENVLVFAATNLPWNVDSAFRRPGRFDRLLLVPPPDASARAQIFAAHLKKLPGGEQIKPKDLARKTELWTGADVKALCERAAENALSESLATGKVVPVQKQDFAASLEQMDSSALEWLATARNYARYSNEGGQYDELSAYLKRIKKW